MTGGRPEDRGRRPAGSSCPGARPRRSDGCISAAGRAPGVKHGQHRTVYRVRFRPARRLLEALPADRPAGVVAGHPSRPEGRTGIRPDPRAGRPRDRDDRAARLGPVPGRWPQGSFLITRALDGTTPLDDVPRPPPARTACRPAAVARDRPGRVRRPVARRRGDTPGPAPGQPARPHSGAPPQFYLIDVHDIDLGRPLDRRARIAEPHSAQPLVPAPDHAGRSPAVLAGVRRAGPTAGRGRRADRADDVTGLSSRLLGVPRRPLPARKPSLSAACAGRAWPGFAVAGPGRRDVAGRIRRRPGRRRSPRRT